MLQPKRTKFRKVQKGRNTGLAHRGSSVSFGTIGLKSVERGRITARQIEAARRTISRRIKRGGKIWIRVFQTNRLLKNRLKFVWVKVKVQLNTGYARLNQAKCYMKSKGFLMSLLLKLLSLLQLNCLSKPLLLNGR